MKERQGPSAAGQRSQRGIRGFLTGRNIAIQAQAGPSNIAEKVIGITENENEHNDPPGAGVAVKESADVAIRSSPDKPPAKRLCREAVTVESEGTISDDSSADSDDDGVDVSDSTSQEDDDTDSLLGASNGDDGPSDIVNDDAPAQPPSPPPAPRRLKPLTQKGRRVQRLKQQRQKQGRPQAQRRARKGKSDGAWQEKEGPRRFQLAWEVLFSWAACIPADESAGEADDRVRCTVCLRAGKPSILAARAGTLRSHQHTTKHITAQEGDVGRRQEQEIAQQGGPIKALLQKNELTSDRGAQQQLRDIYFILDRGRPCLGWPLA